MLVQADGSHNPWLEERGPRFVLLLAVDDATGMVANAVFRQAEDTRGYFILVNGLIRRWGVSWPCTPTATASSSSTAAHSTYRGPSNQLISPAPFGNWECSGYSPVRPKPKAEWNELWAPSRTGW